jgi:U3 small nucleolar RNA-associated protein 14
LFWLQARQEEEEFKRAQERLTLKHRNTSRWARRVLKRGLSLATEGQQDALHDQLRLGQQLRAKAASMHEQDGSASDSRFDHLAMHDAHAERSFSMHCVTLPW